MSDIGPAGTAPRNSAPRTSVFSTGREYLRAILIVLLVALVCYPVSRAIGYRTVSLILLLATALLPLRMGRGPVLAAGVFAAVCWNFLFIPPLFTFTISHIEDAVMLGVFVIVAVVSGVLTSRIRERERLVVQREQRTMALFALTNDLSSAHSLEEVVKTAVAHLRKNFDANIAVFLGEPDGDMKPLPHPASSWSPNPQELEAAAWSYWNERKAGCGSEVFPESRATFYPASGPRYPVGAVGVLPPHGKQRSAEQETLLENFVAQIASAVEREMLNDITKRATVLAESERLYNTVFNSISHELRTPIAAILGASENLQSDATAPASGRHRDHVDEIHTAAQRLNRLVANLLDMSRLESGTIRPKTDWCDVRDLIQSAIKVGAQELAGHPLTVRVPDDTPLIRADFGLLEQALANIVFNAAVHTPATTPIAVDARVLNDQCIITVSDGGPGIDPNDLPRIFEKFYRPAGTPSGGTGLGLPIARGFIEAQSGTVSAANRPEGGMTVTLILPTTSPEAR